MHNNRLLTKQELRTRLCLGSSLVDAYGQWLIDGQECLIFKADDWPESVDYNAVIYIPDLFLNEVAYDRRDLPKEEIDNIICKCYTANDYLQETYENLAAAKSLFYSDDWQSPNVQDLIDCTDEDEAKECYGETWEEMRTRMQRSKDVKDAVICTIERREE